ncbi:uncharacterized protein LOC122570706 [Bombus pyrosoma]|uniref:uncharacterized protein LOC122570706 n=1 Tax=Bombus pyrosoma TaxID=396416 RepID=UPI001CB91652|nr:uncharacterized protein LOC122570706 [Bombus pyrosoma]
MSDYLTPSIPLISTGQTGPLDLSFDSVFNEAFLDFLLRDILFLLSPIEHTGKICTLNSRMPCIILFCYLIEFFEPLIIGFCCINFVENSIIRPLSDIEFCFTWENDYRSIFQNRVLQ